MDKQQVPKQVAVSGFHCGFCGTLDNVSWYCCTCPGALCSECSTRHNTDPTMLGHTISSIFCAQHPDKVSSVCCTDCQRTSCLSCSAENHSSHKVTLLSHMPACGNQDSLSCITSNEVHIKVHNDTDRQEEVIQHQFDVRDTAFIIQPARKPVNTDLAYFFGYVTCLCCCVPVALCAIWAACMSQRAWEKQRDYDRAVRCKVVSYVLSAVSVVMAIGYLVIYFEVIAPAVNKSKYNQL